MTARWTPRSEVASVSDPYTYAVPGPPGAAPLSHFEVVEVTYVDGSVERVPAEHVVSLTTQPSDTAYLIALVVGVSTILLMVRLAFDEALGAGTLVLATSSVVGCALALAGLWSPVRRFRVAALVLTVVPAIVVLAYAVYVFAFIVLILGSGNPNS